MVEKIQNFYQLVEHAYYKVNIVRSIKIDNFSREVIFLLEGGYKVFGRFGVDKVFKAFSPPFFFKFEKIADTERFTKYHAEMLTI